MNDQSIEDSGDRPRLDKNHQLQPIARVLPKRAVNEVLEDDRGA
jgi:hypothetical protein